VTERLWEVDLARTAAILMMVVYHTGYDVDMLGPSVPIDPFSGGWRALQVATGSSFLFIVGVSLAISNARHRARGLSGRALYRRHARRAGQVLAAALLVTVVTRIALGGDDYIRFGILHCIGVAILVLPFLARLAPPLTLAIGVAVIAGGLALADEGPRSDLFGLLVLGVRRTGSAGVDWYPLLPWLGPAVLGLAAGALLYPGGRRGAWGRRLPTPARADLLGLPGRHALPIYLVHQLVLIALVAAALTLAGVDVSLDDFE
jgi:uncharacterized membrane protein